MYGSYDLKLVALSLIVAVMAAYTALDMSGRVSQAQSRRTSLAWLLAGATAMGSGIWSMHFVGMLAYQLPIPMRYDPLITLISLVFAILLSGLALWLVSLRELNWRTVFGGGTAMAAGICGMHYSGMHYSGMAAMKMQPAIQYQPGLFGISVVIALLASMAALRLCFTLRTATDSKGLLRRFGAALFMGCAIAGMHYTGMAAAEIAPNAICGAGLSNGVFALDTQAMGIGIAVIIAQLMLASMVASAVQTAKASELELANKALSEARDAAEQAAKSKAAFLATMSHEIRTPMNAVVGFAGLLSDTHLDHSQKDFVSSIRKSGDHLLGVINNILDFSKMASGKLELERAPFELRLTIEAALDVVAGAADTKGIELNYRIEDGVPAGLEADEARIRQVLINLLSNAVKFTQHGEVVVSVAASPIGAEQSQFHFRIEDTGIGISAEQLPLLFQEFKQADASTARNYGGTGLGLAICQALVNLHGGKIWVQSKLNKGSCFEFTLPAHHCDVEPKGSNTSNHRFLTGKQLLLVDDNSTNIEIMQQQAQAWGMRVHSTHGGTEALNWLTANPHCDLVIIDHHMPDMDGIELATRIRDQQLTTAPLVLMSSQSASLSLAARGDTPFATVLTKPLRQSSLFDAIAELFDNATLVSQPDAANEPYSLPPLSILLAEDNHMNQRVAAMILERMGLDCDIVENGEAAVEAVQHKPYDAVLMDIQMPVLDGLKATLAIREFGDSVHQPFIIALTANAMRGDREMCVAAGMNGYVAKPIDRQALLTELKKINSPAASEDS